MTTIKKNTLALILFLGSTIIFAQHQNFNEYGEKNETILLIEKPLNTNSNNQSKYLQTKNKIEHERGKLSLYQEGLLLGFSSKLNEPSLDLKLSLQEKDYFFDNKRNVYSSMWAFASLNYLYADLVGLMDANVLAQYQKGVVNNTKITPEFLTIAAGFMQIPIANVFLPHLIKNEKTLRVVQIVSGTIMTLVQSGTLFVGKPTPYYALFSVFEIAATTYITIDAIKWKPLSKKHQKSLN